MSDPATDAPVVIRAGTATDADGAARLHAALITEGFLAHLGPRFLRHLYRCIAAGPDSFLLVAAAGGSGPPVTGGARPEPAPMAGFLAGALDLRALYRRFALRHGVQATVTSLPRLVRAVPSVWETLRHGTGPPEPETSGAELHTIAVDPVYRGRHLGSLLVDSFLKELVRRGVPDAQVVVGADNGPAVALYQSAGFRPARSFELHRGTTSLLMRRPG